MLKINTNLFNNSGIVFAVLKLHPRTVKLYTTPAHDKHCCSEDKPELTVNTCYCFLLMGMNLWIKIASWTKYCWFVTLPVNNYYPWHDSMIAANGIDCRFIEVCGEQMKSVSWRGSYNAPLLPIAFHRKRPCSDIIYPVLSLSHTCLSVL